LQITLEAPDSAPENIAYLSGMKGKGICSLKVACDSSSHNADVQLSYPEKSGSGILEFFESNPDRDISLRGLRASVNVRIEAGEKPAAP
jgi:hypothetical protein